MSEKQARRTGQMPVLDPFAESGWSLPRELAQHMETCPVHEALKLFQIVTGALNRRGIFRTQHCFGDYNERLIQEYFGSQRDLPALALTAPGTWGFDATVRSGERYNFKATTTNRVELPELKSNRKRQFKERAFDYLIVGHYSEALELLRLIQISWAALKESGGRRTLTIAQLEAIGDVLYAKEE